MSAAPVVTAFTVDRLTRAVIEAAGVWHEANRCLTDAGIALDAAIARGTPAEIAMMEHNKANAFTAAEYAYQQVNDLVKHTEKPKSWSEVAANGIRYLVTWSPWQKRASILPEN